MPTSPESKPGKGRAAHWIVELEDGTRVFFSSTERAIEFAQAYQELHGAKVAVLEMEE